jgi:hypothetical protein
MGTHGEQRKYPPKENASTPISHQNPKKKKKKKKKTGAPKLLIGCLKIMVLKLVVIIFGLGYN